MSNHPKRPNRSWRRRNKRMARIRNYSIAAIILLLFAMGTFFLAAIAHDKGGSPEDVLAYWLATLVFFVCSMGCMIEADQC